MSTLVFTVAINGYNLRFASCLDSHRQWAARHGYDYVAITRPVRISEVAVAAWLKLTVLAAALRGGYDTVVFLDADAEVRATAPGLAAIDFTEDVMLARGRSGRWNSGVIVARDTAAGRAFVDRVIASAAEDIPAAARANLKYENGNVIYCADTYGGVGELEPVWNNTWQPDLADHVRHYTGPLAATYHPRRWAVVVQRLVKRTLRRAGPAPAARDDAFVARLEELTGVVLRRYPRLVSPPDGA